MTGQPKKSQLDLSIIVCAVPLKMKRQKAVASNRTPGAVAGAGGPPV
jgi:hypothetical protein